MDFIKNFTPTPLNVLKALGLLFAVLFVLLFVGQLVATPVFRGGSTGGMGMIKISPTGSSNMMYDSATFEASAPASYKGESVGMMLSSRNVYPIVPPSMGGVGSNLEDFEVTEYNASIETRNKDRDCDVISGMKTLSYVVFQNSNLGDTNCSYTFKVLHKNVPEVLAKIKALNPKQLYENKYTIKKQIDDFTSEKQILEKKLSSINKTLESALRSYDDITSLAVRTEDVATLAKIIESKIQIIERLTQESINTAGDLERLSRAKDEQMDKLEYTYFNVGVYENKFVDFKAIKDSWKFAIKSFVQNINISIQNATIDVISFFFILVPYFIYLLILLFVAKYSWKIAKNIWNK